MSMIATMDSVFNQHLKLMGNRFEFSVVSSDAEWAHEKINEAIEEVRRIERLLTTYDDSSVTNKINAMAGVEPVVVDDEVFSLIERSLRISSLTQGAFDITFGSIDKRLWNFDKNMTSLPDPDVARASVRLINFRNVLLDKAAKTVFLKERGMRIGFGGIGKGYAADCAKVKLLAAGVNHGIVNAAGDLTVWGTQPNQRPWTVGIADPDKKGLPFASLELRNSSIATSGTYEKYAVIDGIKYSHTIDPRTGFPVRGIKSVTIICASAEIADAITTPVMVMGIKAGIGLINQLKDIACVVIDDNDVLFTSRNINLSA